MNKTVLQCSGALALCLVSTVSVANDFKFSLGVGLPFLLTPEVSYSQPGADSRWYANYKMGLDDGFSGGYERALDADKKHALGVLIGAFSVVDDKRPCPDSDKTEMTQDNVFAQISFDIGSALGCALSEAFDEESLNGIALTYSYQANGLNESGWRVRFELGHGEAARSKRKDTSGGFIVSYQF